MVLKYNELLLLTIFLPFHLSSSFLHLFTFSPEGLSFKTINQTNLHCPFRHSYPICFSPLPFSGSLLWLCI